MLNLDLCVRAAGALQIALAVLHLYFARRFHWQEEMARLSLLNRQIFVVHALFICFVLVAMGSLSLLRPETLWPATPLSRLVLGAMSAFWALRLICQWFVYDSRLWRGDRFNTLVHGGATLLWTYFTAVYAGVLLAGG